MPKMKTHSGAKKRIKVTGSGKYRRRQAGRGHLKLAKGKDVFRRRKGESDLAPGDKRIAKRLLNR
ncbi:MAG TPA: bL35 family ribosomal protein [Acidimicrobiia bacterium]|jgi:large subunit ribosomal protein L35|nr:bL35 family ribosomal protein [Acidimicrobiia bacterium]